MDDRELNVISSEIDWVSLQGERSVNIAAAPGSE
jgi:hypothetical protein